MKGICSCGIYWFRVGSARLKYPCVLLFRISQC